MAVSTVRFESHQMIERPPAEVFGRLADLPGYGRWMHRNGLFRGCRLTSEPPVGAGTTYVDSTWMGRFAGVVTEFEPSTRIAFSETLSVFGRPAMTAKPEYTLRGDGEATVIDHIAVGELHGWMRLMKPMAALMAKGERTRTLRSLVRSLERGK